MVKVLHKYGLLLGIHSSIKVSRPQTMNVALELSDAALDRNIGTKNRADVFADQIKKAGSDKGYILRAEKAVENIKRLGSLTDGRLKAMDLLINAADC